MMNAIIYLYFRIKKINNNENNLTIASLFCVIILTHLMPFLYILGENYPNVFTNAFIENELFVVLIALFIPISLIIYLFLRKHNERIQEGCKKLELMSKYERRRKNGYLWLYIIASFVFLVLGVTSSDWVPWLKKMF